MTQREKDMAALKPPSMVWHWVKLFVGTWVAVTLILIVTSGFPILAAMVFAFWIDVLFAVMYANVYTYDGPGLTPLMGALGDTSQATTEEATAQTKGPTP